MKNITIILILLVQPIFVHAQNDSIQKQELKYNDYNLLRNFLSQQKNNPGIFSTHIKVQWNSKLYQDQYEQLLAINKKKEFYPELLFDNRFISHSYPSRFGSQNYMWVSTQRQYNSIGEQIASDIISDVVGGMLKSKKQRFNTRNKKGYYTPAGLKY